MNIAINITGAELKAMLAFVGVDEPATAGLCVCMDGRLMATDSFAMVVRRPAGGFATADTVGRRLIPVAALKDAARAKAVRIEVVDEVVTIDADGAVRTCVLAPDVPPPFHLIFPTQPEAVQSIGLNPQHIACVAGVDKALGKESRAWTFSFYGSARPVVAEHGAWSVLIMPRAS